MSESTTLLVWGIIAHLVADWVLQTEWMALNKSSLTHASAWAHAGVHLLCMMVIFTWPLALFIAITHLLIDTRIPVKWWMRAVKRISPSAPNIFVIETGLDQAFHVMVLVVVVLVI